MMSSLLSLLLPRQSLLQLLFLILFVSSSTRTVFGETGEELANLYKDILLEYQVFPPLSADPETWQDETIKPIEVVIGTSLVSVDSILPGQSEFTVTSRSILYWKKSECDQTETHQMACSTRLQGGNGVRFIQGMQAKGIPSLGLALPVENAHSAAFAKRGKESEQPDMEIYQIQNTFAQTFDVRNYPYEYYELQVSVVSAYSENVVRLTDIGTDVGILNPSIPPGWDFHGVSCRVGKTTEGRAITQLSEEQLAFYSYDCVIKVSRTNPSWWLTSFFLAAGICAMAVAGNLGIMSRNAAEARDDKDAVRRELHKGTRLMGTFTVGLLLTYVFQVEVSPYGQPIEYWPSIPTSSMIYMLGVFYIIIQSMAGMIVSIFIPNPLAREGFVGQIGRAYDVSKLPVEGHVGEDHQPLLRHKYKPESKKAKNKEEETTVAPAAAEIERNSQEEEQPQQAEEEEAAFEPIPNSRKNNQRMYNVLSVEEAYLVNKYVKELLYFKLALITIVVICSIAILGSASARHNRLVD